MKKKITITVEADVAATLEQKARERGVSRGRLIEYLIHAAWITPKGAIKPLFFLSDIFAVNKGEELITN